MPTPTAVSPSWGSTPPKYAEFVSGKRRSASGAPINVTKAMRTSRSPR